MQSEIIELKKTYEKAQLKLIDKIAKAETKGNVTTFQRRVLAGIRAEIRALNEYAENWVKEYIPKAYGAAQGKVVLNLIRNATGQLKDANNFVGRRIADDLRKAGLEAVAEKLSMGETVKQTKAKLIERLTDKGITTVKAGRNIKLDAYAEMVARTTTREATNRGTIDEIQNEGRDLVQITTTGTSCPICLVYEGRVYSISGKDKRYPPLKEAFGEFSTIHPNCNHNVVPYFEEFDKNSDKVRKESNRPFELQDKDKAKIERYNKDQLKKAERRNDRNKWEQAKLEDPKGTPKTFAGFRSQQRASR